METITLKADKREDNIKAKSLRAKGIIPAVIYNHGQSSEIQVDGKEINRLFAQGVSESVLLDINLDGKSETAFIKDFQVHPVSEDVLHIDFYRVTAGEKIKTNIPIHLEGKAIGVKEGGVLETFLHDVEIEIFPRFLVPQLSVDISNLQIGDSIHVDDIKLPEESKLLVDGNPIVCHVTTSAKLDSETKAEEADQPAEGEEKPTEE